MLANRCPEYSTLFASNKRGNNHGRAAWSIVAALAWVAVPMNASLNLSVTPKTVWRAGPRLAKLSCVTSRA